MSERLSYCQIMIGRAMTGLIGLREALEALAAEGLPADAPEVEERLLERVRERNWVPPKAELDYRAALRREYRLHLEALASGKGGRTWRDPRKDVPTWYPTILAERCDGCRECLDACPREVLGWDDAANVALVLEPYECAPGCERCARACKPRAIIMPARAVLHQRAAPAAGAGSAPSPCDACSAGECGPCEHA